MIGSPHGSGGGRRLRRAMSLIDWNKACSVNVAIIDRQHRKLVDAVNELHDAMTRDKGNDALPAVFNKLIRYINSHFAVEEELMLDLDYPDYYKHRAEHKECAKKILTAKLQFQRGELGVALQLSVFLSDWLRGHMLSTDKKYKAFFNRNGIY